MTLCEFNRNRGFNSPARVVLKKVQSHTSYGYKFMPAIFGEDCPTLTAPWPVISNAPTDQHLTGLFSQNRLGVAGFLCHIKLGIREKGAQILIVWLAQKLFHVLLFKPNYFDH